MKNSDKQYTHPGHATRQILNAPESGPLQVARLPGNRIPSILSYAAAGATGTLVHYVVMFAALGMLEPVAATTLGALAGCAINFVLAHHLVFAGKLSKRQTLARFLSVAGLGLVLNAVIVKALAAGLPVSISQLCATGTVFLFTYSLNRDWTFNER